MSVMLILVAIIGFLIFAGGMALGVAALFFMRKEEPVEIEDSGSNWSSSTSSRSSASNWSSSTNWSNNPNWS